MNHIRWAAWGVIDIESMERMQRRNYIKRARDELKEVGITLHSGGGSKSALMYAVIQPGAADDKLGPAARRKDKVYKQAFAGQDAFKKICAWVLENTGDVEKPHGDERMV